MTLPNNSDRLERFIHECFHEIAKDEEMKDVWRDMVSIIISKWEDFKGDNFTSSKITEEELREVFNQLREKYEEKPGPTAEDIKLYGRIVNNCFTSISALLKKKGAL